MGALKKISIRLSIKNKLSSRKLRSIWETSYSKKFYIEGGVENAEMTVIKPMDVIN
jgi:hypothetical protein